MKSKVFTRACASYWLKVPIIWPWNKAWPFEHIWISARDVLSIGEFGPVVLEKIFQNFTMSLLSDLRKGVTLYSNKLNSTSSMLRVKFEWNWPSGYREDDNVKSLQDRRTDEQTTDIKRSEKFTWTFDSGGLKRNGIAQVNQNLFCNFYLHVGFLHKILVLYSRWIYCTFLHGWFVHKYY